MLANQQKGTKEENEMDVEEEAGVVDVVKHDQMQCRLTLQVVRL